MEENPATLASTTTANFPNHSRRRRNNRITNAQEGSEQHSPSPANPRNRGRGRGAHQRGGVPRGHIPSIDEVGGTSASASPSRDSVNPSPTGNPRPRGRNQNPASHSNTKIEGGQPPQETSTQPSRRRNQQRFNAHLSVPSARPPDQPHEPKPSAKYNLVPLKDDLTSRLIQELSAHPYPDCAICFNSIHPAQPTWSCSPSSAVAGSEKGDAESSQCCWITFHLKCVRSWASKSVKEISDALRARGEEVTQAVWLCPACRSKRVSVPSGYKCFCGSTIDPKPPRLATPHSCGSPCSRKRECGHPCPISCHPGPCPPCQVTTQLRCYCSSKALSFKCSNLSSAKDNGPGNNSNLKADLSCGYVCFRELGCKNHACQDVCHPGDCKPCQVEEKGRCYCGKEEKNIACGKGDPKDCETRDEGKWLGVFECHNTCSRSLDCRLHNCSKPCHPPSLVPATCPLSPSLVTTCPCGKHLLVPAEASHFPPDFKLTRTKCSDKIPICNSTCSKPLEGCSHPCSVTCHTGPCPPCTVKVVRPCRCGAATRDIKCYEDQLGPAGEILCDRQCTALRACGRHQCSRVCCPLASLASISKGKGKRRVLEETAVDEHGWHVCDLVCGKPLSCGDHRCEEPDHKGPCPPCLRSSFEELFCYCGKTILEPPVPCGTRITCSYPCDRPPLPCGHPKSQHACHEDPRPCPPCPFLASKMCGCGKKYIDNVKCSQEKVSCGTPCGKLKRCGFHRCEKLCHSDECGPCQTSCGKPRKLCLPGHHPCEQQCHAPTACPEAEPCSTIINLSCPCTRIRQPAPCGRSITHPAGREGSQQLKCTPECGVAKRNARLAEALGITTDSRADVHKATYSDDLISFARANSRFCTMVEKSFADFISSDKRSQVLAHMPENRRQFVIELAVVYRTDTKIVDQEPYRSVQIIRRIDTRIPNPLLSNAFTTTASSNASSSNQGLGKLADLRSSWRPMPPKSAPDAPAASAAPNRWTSVVSGPEKSAPLAASPWANTTLRSTTPLPSASTPRRALTPTVAPVVPVDTGPIPDNWEEDI